jgi:hypothetical protein
VPTSDKQLVANRANAAKSTGPLRHVPQPRRGGHHPMTPDLVGDGDIEITRAQNRNYAFADGFHRLARKDNTFTLFLRCRTSFSLFDSGAERPSAPPSSSGIPEALPPEFPKEPISEVQPQENEPASTPPEEPISPPKRTRSPPPQMPPKTPPKTDTQAANPALYRRAGQPKPSSISVSDIPFRI